MNTPYVFKKCSKCGKWLVANTVNFNKAKGCKDGLRGACKICQKKYKKQYREQNKETIAKHNKQYREQNKEVITKRKKEYYKANKEAILEQHKIYREANKEAKAKHDKEYYEANKEAIKERVRRYGKQYNQTPQGQIVAFNSRNRRRVKEQEQGSGITKEQWLECMEFFDWKCAYSGKCLGGSNNKKRSIDHIIALNNGGVNEVWNLVPMIKSLNSSKQDRDMMTWYTKQDFFSEERLNKIKDWQEYAYNKWGK